MIVLNLITWWKQSRLTSMIAMMRSGGDGEEELWDLKPRPSRGSSRKSKPGNSRLKCDLSFNNWINNRFNKEHNANTANRKREDPKPTQ